MKEQTRNAIDLLLRGATRFGSVLRQHFKAKTAPDCETGSVVEKEVSVRGLASLEKRVERIASQLARIEKNSERGGRALTNALDDFEREYNALSRGAKRYCRRSDAWIASQRKFTAFALGYLRGLASAPQGAKRAAEAPVKAESPKPEAKPQTDPQKPAAKAPEGSRELPTAEDCRDRGVEAFKGKYAIVQAIACCVHAAARDHGVKQSEFRVTRARGSHLSLTVRMVRTGRSMRFTGTTTTKGYRSACNSVSAFFSSLAKASKKDEKPTVKPNYPKTRTVQVALASHGLRAESTMPADLLALEYSAYEMTAADQDRIADEHRAMVERLLKKGVEIDPRVAGHYNLSHVEHAPVVPAEPKLTTEQLSELTKDQQELLARLETMPLDDAESEYQKIAKAARFTGSGIDAVFRGKHRVAIVENKREIQEMKGRNEDLPDDKRLASLKGTAHEGKANAVDYWIVFNKSVSKAEAEKTLGDYLDVLDAAGHQGRNDIVSLWTKTMRALGYSDSLIRANHLKDAAKRVVSKRRAEAAKESTTDVKWVRVELEQNVVRLKFGRKPAAGSEKALQAAGYGLVSKGHESPYWRATWNQKARDAALAVGANAADLPEIAASKPAEKPAPKAEEKPMEAPAPVAAPPQVEAAPAPEASKPDANLETMAKMVAELLVRPEGATTGEISAAGGGTPAAVYKALAGLGVATITGTQVNPTGGGRNVGTDNVWQVRGVDDNGVSGRGAKRIRIVLAALGLPPADVKVTNEETPTPAPRPATIPPPARLEVPEAPKAQLTYRGVKVKKIAFVKMAKTNMLVTFDEKLSPAMERRLKREGSLDGNSWAGSFYGEHSNPFFWPYNATTLSMLLWIASEHELPPIGNDEFRGSEKQANRRIAFDQNGNGAADSLRKHWTEIRTETGRLIDDINRLKGGVSEKRLETINEDLQDIRTVMADQGMWATLHAYGEAYGLLVDVEAWVKQGAKTGKGPKTAVGQVEVGNGITIVSDRKAKPRDAADDDRIYRLSDGREALVSPFRPGGTGDLRYSALIGELEAVASTPEHAIRKALKNPTVRHGEEPAPEAPVAAPSVPAPQPAAPVETEEEAERREAAEIMRALGLSPTAPAPAPAPALRPATIPPPARTEVPTAPPVSVPASIPEPLPAEDPALTRAKALADKAARMMAELRGKQLSPAAPAPKPTPTPQEIADERMRKLLADLGES
ncbi:MAG: hypothetical protein IPJ61_20055 [Tessaracoccus sp.]|uniref:hypothetical protein n=1 Tax=Tessaracoccus sp. TaxID=1971211 RepID=UPI001EB8E1C8|nr:hypothetical protein [Tessaracoccus sp.]MBK7823281.1 hypothetical protein [Tessaracoccus sp.]